MFSAKITTTTPRYVPHIFLFQISRIDVARVVQNTFYALYRSFTQCAFIEEDEGIAFYKNADGQAQRQLAEHIVADIKHGGWKAESQDNMPVLIGGDP